MAALLGAVLLVVGVMALIKVSGVVPRTVQAVNASKGAFEIISDPGLGDDRKEALLQGYSVSLLKSFLDLLMRSAASIGIPIVVLWVLEFAGMLSLKEVLDLTFSWPFLLCSGVVAIPAFRFLTK